MPETELFMILGRSRTGSNMVVRLLNQHPQIHCEGEIFRQVTPTEWPLELARLRRVEAARAGFKIFYYHGSGDRDGLWGRLEAEEGLPVVHLRRRNILRTATSRKLAMSRNEWISVGKDPNGSPKRVTFSPEELRRDFRTTRENEKTFAWRFASHPSLDVEYEELAADPLGTCAAIVDLLGLPPLPRGATVKTRKQNPEPLPELIGNYGELADHFADSRWAEFFES